MITLLLPENYTLKVTAEEVKLIMTALGWTGRISSSSLILSGEQKAKMVAMRDDIMSALDSLEMGQEVWPLHN